MMLSKYAIRVSRDVAFERSVGCFNLMLKCGIPIVGPFFWREVGTIIPEKTNIRQGILKMKRDVMLSVEEISLILKFIKKLPR